MEQNQNMIEILRTTAKNLHLMLLKIADNIEKLEEENKKFKSKIEELEKK